jgi:hypothetical protein
MYFQTKSEFKRGDVVEDIRFPGSRGIVIEGETETDEFVMVRWDAFKHFPATTNQAPVCILQQIQ